jgi:hypothetical protein
VTASERWPCWEFGLLMVARQFLRTNRGSTCLGKLNTVRAAVFATSAFNPTSYEMLHWTLVHSASEFTFMLPIISYLVRQLNIITAA